MVLDSGQAVRSRFFRLLVCGDLDAQTLEWLNMPLLVGVAALLLK